MPEDAQDEDHFKVKLSLWTRTFFLLSIKVYIALNSLISHKIKMLNQ